MKGGFLYMMVITLPLALVLSLMIAMVGKPLVKDILGIQGAEMVTLYTAPVRTFWKGLPSDYQVDTKCYYYSSTLVLPIACLNNFDC